MKSLLCALLICAGFAAADDAADRAAINRTIATLNEYPASSAIFTGDSNGRSIIDGLWKHQIEAQLRAVFSTPRVVISHEPWGEAQISPPIVFPASPARISADSIRFLTPDVALADGSFTSNDQNGVAHRTPLLFVMQRDNGTGGGWKIASVRFLAEP